MISRILLILLIVCAAGFAIYIQEPVSAHVPSPQLYILNYSILEDQKINIPPSILLRINSTNESETMENTTNQQLENISISLLADCSGIHVFSNTTNGSLPDAIVSVYKMPRYPDYVEVASGISNLNGEFIFNTTESFVGMIVSKQGYSVMETRFDIPVLDCTEIQTNASDLENESSNVTQISNATQINQTKNDSFISQNESDAIVPTIEERRASDDNYFGFSKGDILLASLALAAIIAIILLLGGKGNDPMPPPSGKISNDPMPPPIGKSGAVSNDPMPPPKN